MSNEIKNTIQQARADARSHIFKSFSNSEEMTADESQIAKGDDSEIEKGKHNVGDMHPNGKWVWKETKPGHFDWRNRGAGDAKLEETIKTINEINDKKEKPVVTSDSIKQKLAEAPIGSKVTGGGYGPWVKILKNTWENKGERSLAHNDEVFSRIGTFRDFKIVEAKSVTTDDDKKPAKTNDAKEFHRGDEVMWNGKKEKIAAINPINQKVLFVSGEEVRLVQLQFAAEKKPDTSKKELSHIDQIKEIIKKSTNPERAFELSKEVKGVPSSEAKAFAAKYNPKGNLTPFGAFLDFYNEVKGIPADGGKTEVALTLRAIYDPENKKTIIGVLVAQHSDLKKQGKPIPSINSLLSSFIKTTDANDNDINSLGDPEIEYIVKNTSSTKLPAWHKLASAEKIKREKSKAQREVVEEKYMDGSLWSNGDDDDDMKIEKRKSGFYGKNNKFDFEAPDYKTAIAKLKGWGYKHIGY